MIKNYVLILVILFFASCCKGIIEMEFLYNNTTIKKIEMRVYSADGRSSSFIEAKSSSKSTINTSFISPYSTSPVDSILVFIDDKFEQTHYNYTVKKASSNAKVLAFENPLNLLNINNYQKNRNELSCEGSHTTYIYSF